MSLLAGIDYISSKQGALMYFLLYVEEFVLKPILIIFVLCVPYIILFMQHSDFACLFKYV